MPPTINYWKGTAPAVAQVSSAQITGNDVTTTYKLTVGGQVVSCLGQAGGVNATATSLAAAWNASTHPYFTGVTASTSTDTVILTSDTAGVPFVATSSVTGGAGTIGAVAAVTANSGPNCADTLANWSLGALPTTGDTAVIKDNAVNICWGLTALTDTLAELRVEKTYTGKIGLRSTEFATSADGATYSATTAPEYRTTYLYIEATLVNLGQNFGTGSPSGSSRIKLNTAAVASTITVHGTASSSAETGLPAVRLLTNENTTDLYVRSAPGGVGVAVDVPDETSLLHSVTVSDKSTSSRVILGLGVTYDHFTQQGGNNLIQAAATVASVACQGGNLQSEGDFTVTAGTIEGGTWACNHVKSAGNAITTLTASGGTMDATQSAQPRTWATVNLNKGGSIKFDKDVLTITTLVGDNSAEGVTLTAA